MSRVLKALRTRLPACLGLLALAGNCAASEPRRVPDTIEERVLPCTSCHGQEGRATPEGYFPRIAGKPAGYLYNQLVNFRDGRRNYPLMVYLVEYLTDDYLREIAQHFAGLELPYPAPQPSDLSPQQASRAQSLVFQGDAGRNIPACAHCHGESLLGTNPTVPGLLGLSRYYLYAQLNLWKNGGRRAHAPDCMATVASRLTPEEVDIVSRWLAAHAVPPGAKPANELRRPLPLPCGSVPE